MKETLKLTLVEFDIEWESPKDNLNYLDEILAGIDTDLVVLPEMFTTGFTMGAAKVAEEPLGASFQWMQAKAKELNCAISGSISTKENNQFYNRHYFVTPTEYFVYDKKHLFGYGKENQVYHAGNEIVTANYLGWKFRLITCYDLRFPVWCRNTDAYDALICVASWPAVRVEPWKALLKARAIENMAYCVGVNRIGIDDYDLKYNGNSKVFDPVGEDLKLTKQKTLLQVEISKNTIQKYRDTFGFLADQDEFNLI